MVEPPSTISICSSSSHYCLVSAGGNFTLKAIYFHWGAQIFTDSWVKSFPLSVVLGSLNLKLLYLFSSSLKSMGDTC